MSIIGRCKRCFKRVTVFPFTALVTPPWQTDAQFVKKYHGSSILGDALGDASYSDDNVVPRQNSENENNYYRTRDAGHSNEIYTLMGKIERNWIPEVITHPLSVVRRWRLCCAMLSLQYHERHSRRSTTWRDCLRRYIHPLAQMGTFRMNGT